ncbi:hypothetical protein ACH9L7_16645 (plasmid) [Haloferax sp. S1W]|uniref:hypothetical protein n=1 Tax=Haloferax sp. S1W TaxID=3377110 RepID=UPI0037C56F79
MVSASVLTEAIETYNEYRSPMATATLVESADSSFVVRFEGPFCRMCCDFDYFEDLIYELEEFNVDSSSVAVADISYTGNETYVVEFTTSVY